MEMASCHGTSCTSSRCRKGTFRCAQLCGPEKHHQTAVAPLRASRTWHSCRPMGGLHTSWSVPFLLPRSLSGFRSTIWVARKYSKAVELAKGRGARSEAYILPSVVDRRLAGGDSSGGELQMSLAGGPKGGSGILAEIRCDQSRMAGSAERNCLGCQEIAQED